MLAELEVEERASLASSALLQPLVATAFLDEDWPEPIAVACFSKSGKVPLFMPNRLSLLFPLASMPQSEATMVAEQLKPDQGRLLFAAAYENSDDALAATRQLESRLQRWPAVLSPWYKDWDTRFAPQASPHGNPRFGPTALEALSAELSGETLAFELNRRIWVALVVMTYPIEPLQPLLDKQTLWEDTSNNVLQVHPIASNCFGGFWVFATRTWHRESDPLATLPFD